MRSLVEMSKERELELVDGVKVIHEDGWALALPDPEEPVTHVWAESSSDAERPPPRPGVRPPHPPTHALALRCRTRGSATSCSAARLRRRVLGRSTGGAARPANRGGPAQRPPPRAPPPLPSGLPTSERAGRRRGGAGGGVDADLDVGVEGGDLGDGGDRQRLTAGERHRRALARSSRPRARVARPARRGGRRPRSVHSVPDARPEEPRHPAVGADAELDGARRQLGVTSSVPGGIGVVGAAERRADHVARGAVQRRGWWDLERRTARQRHRGRAERGRRRVLVEQDRVAGDQRRHLPERRGHPRWRRGLVAASLQPGRARDRR